MFESRLESKLEILKNQVQYSIFCDTLTSVRALTHNYNVTLKISNTHTYREIMLFIGKPMGRSIMISTHIHTHTHTHTHTRTHTHTHTHCTYTHTHTHTAHTHLHTHMDTHTRTHLHTCKHTQRFHLLSFPIGIGILTTLGLSQDHDCQ